MNIPLAVLGFFVFTLGFVVSLWMIWVTLQMTMEFIMLVLEVGFSVLAFILVILIAVLLFIYMMTFVNSLIYLFACIVVIFGAIGINLL